MFFVSSRPDAVSPARRLLAVGSLALLGAVACRHEPPPPSAWTPTARAARASAVGFGAAPPLVLHQASLGDGTVLSALLDGLDLVGGGDELLEILADTASRLGPADLQQNPAARSFTCHAVYRLVRAPGFAERFGRIRPLVDGLHRAVPDAPETLFARAFLRWILLADGEGGLRDNDLDPAIIEDLAGDLQRLVDDHPGFVGPGPFDQRRLRAELSAVRALLARLPVAPAAAVTATEAGTGDRPARAAP